MGRSSQITHPLFVVSADARHVGSGRRHLDAWTSLDDGRLRLVFAVGHDAERHDEDGVPS